MDNNELNTNLAEVGTGLISRQAAIDAMGRATWAINRINELPSAQPQPRTGKWIVHLYKFGEERYECDNCHGRCGREYKFCPNCGADMRGGQDERMDV